MIFKYKFLSFEYTGDMPMGQFFGYCPDLYDGRSDKYCHGNYTLLGGGSLWRLAKGFGNKYYTNYELAFEIKPGQFKTWLNGKLMNKSKGSVFKVINPYISFGAKYSTKFYLNDVFCINKSEFLPDQYTVNWREPWYDLIYKPIYIHNEDVYCK